MSELSGDIGKGVVGFLLGAASFAIGFKGRFNANEKEMARQGEEINDKVDEGTCKAVHRGMEMLAKRDRVEVERIFKKLENMDQKLDHALELKRRDNND